MRTLTLMLGLASTALVGCSHEPTAPSRPCRKWPLRYTTDGRTFNCKALPPTTPSCSAFPTNLEITWSYRSQFDFVHEADVPNRILALGQTTVGCGSFATTGCNTSVVKYDYDAQRRLVRRERSWSHSLGGGGTIDIVSYTAWDRRGRPTQGEVEKDGGKAPLTIVYDDVRRIAQASNGDLVEQDAYGNVIREAGSSFETLYTIEAFQDVCEEGA